MPIVRAIGEGLAGDRITRLVAILNGTTNAVLSRSGRTGVTGGAGAGVVAGAVTLATTLVTGAATVFDRADDGCDRAEVERVRFGRGGR